jgi:hypothetical protein
MRIDSVTAGTAITFTVTSSAKVPTSRRLAGPARRESRTGVLNAYASIASTAGSLLVADWARHMSSVAVSTIVERRQGFTDISEAN